MNKWMFLTFQETKSHVLMILLIQRSFINYLNISFMYLSCICMITCTLWSRWNLPFPPATVTTVTDDTTLNWLEFSN